MSHGNKMSAQPASRRKSTLDVIKSGALTLALELYKETGREVRGLGIAVDEATFEAAAVLYVERTQEQAAKLQHASLPTAQRLQLIREAGYFDGKIDNAGQEIPIRIAREDLIRG